MTSQSRRDIKGSKEEQSKQERGDLDETSWRRKRLVARGEEIGTGSRSEGPCWRPSKSQRLRRSSKQNRWTNQLTRVSHCGVQLPASERDLGALLSRKLVNSALVDWLADSSDKLGIWSASEESRLYWRPRQWREISTTGKFWHFHDRQRPVYVYRELSSTQNSPSTVEH